MTLKFIRIDVEKLGQKKWALRKKAATGNFDQNDAQHLQFL